MSELYYPETLVVQHEMFANDAAGVLPQNAVVHGDSPDAVLPGNSGSTNSGVLPQKPVVQRCTTPKRSSGSTAAAQAYAPLALTRGGDTPLPVPVKHKPRAVTDGRAAGGPACLGCSHYQTAKLGSPITMRGRCDEVGRIVAAHGRFACALYRFHGLDRIQGGAPC